MLYYNIAGFNISVAGTDSEYVRMRFDEYKTAPFENADLEVDFSEVDKISAPEGELIAIEDGYRKYYKIDGGFGIYDFHGEDEYIAAVEFDDNVKKAKCSVVDVVAFGGMDNEIRCCNMIGELFRYFILEHSGIVMHASSVMYNGGGIMFSAPSGTGKSTHTRLWCEAFKDEVVMINDDSPALTFGETGVTIHGTPWSGKTEINHNVSAPLKAIVMLTRGEENKIRRIGADEAVFLTLREVRRPLFKDKFEITLEYVSKLLASVPVYMLSCNISHDAARLVKNTIFGE